MQTNSVEPEEALNFLTKQVRNGEGAVELSLTEGGDIGVFISGLKRAQGVGDTVREAVQDFIRRGENPHDFPVQ